MYADGAPTADHAIFDVAPVLGICYGMQLIAQLFGANVLRGGRREYGRATIRPAGESMLLRGFSADEGAFIQHFQTAAPTAERGYRVHLGVVPTNAESG